MESGFEDGAVEMCVVCSVSGMYGVWCMCGVWCVVCMVCVRGVYMGV